MRMSVSALRTMGLVALGLGAAAAHPAGFPPGWNNVAMTPPMGWRSWNAWGNRVSQDNMQASIDALVAKIWTVEGKPNVSLYDAGYTTAGIDEGWEGCGQGVNGTQHAANGDPVINKKFPDMAGLVKYGHDKGFKMGWYENGCACGERKGLMTNYEGDVRQLHELDFDGVKLDGCGAQRNMTLYAELMKATGKSYLIENCHWGRCTSSDDSSCPTADWCPFNWYRTSGDINASPMSWFKNLQTTIQFQDPKTPLSRPGCWAYPDMLEVGRILLNGKMDPNWNRAHFGAWCVVSAPLILGMDVTQQAMVGAVIDIITNAEAIAVNQAWAGHPGALVWSGSAGTSYPAVRACNLQNAQLKQQGWALEELKETPPRGEESPGSQAAAGKLVAVVAPGGGCLRVQGGGYAGGAGGLVVAKCNASDAAQSFAYNATTRQLKDAKGHCVDAHSGGPILWMYGCTSGANDLLSFNAANKTLGVAGRCVGVEQDDPAGATFASSLQAWAKPLAGGDVAVLVINPDSAPHAVSLPLASLPLPAGTSAPLAVRDIWARAALAPIAKGASTVNMSVGGMDSIFLRLSKSK